MHVGWDGGSWLAMTIPMLVWLVVIVLVVWLLVRGLVAVERRSPGGEGARDEALELLRHRFASGEINAQEYEERMALLQRK